MVSEATASAEVQQLYSQDLGDLSAEQAQLGQLQSEAAADQAQLTQLSQGLPQPIQPGPEPTFNEQPPQDQFNNIVGISPFLMAIGALGGTLGRNHGIAMLESTNAMMKGIVTGSDEAYQSARQQFADRYQKYQDDHARWMAVYKVYMDTMAGKVDRQQRATDAANKAVGLEESKMAATKKQIETLVALNPKIQAAYEKIRQGGQAGGAGVAGMSTSDIEVVAGKLRSAGISVPSGMSGKALIANTIPYIESHPRRAGEDIQAYGDRVAKEVRAEQAGGKFTSTAATKVATQATAVAKAENALVIDGGFLDQLKPYVDKVDFDQVKKLGELEKWSKEQMTDPTLLGYHDRILDIRSQLAQALARGGQVTDAVRAEAKEYVPDIITPQSYAEARKAVEQAVKTEKRAIDREKEDFGIGSTPTDAGSPPVAPAKTVVRTGVSPTSGQKFVQYSDGTIAPAQ